MTMGLIMKSSYYLQVPFLIFSAFWMNTYSKVEAAELPPGFTEVKITDELVNPTSFRFAPDGRIFVLQQGGQVRVIKNGVLLPEPFLSLSVDSRGEHGLLGIAFDPNFNLNPYVYIYYTALTPAIHNRVSRFTVVGDRALENSEKIVFELDNTGRSIFHSGGAIHFSRDGKLFLGVGDNALRFGANAQDLSNPFGKILRINIDGSIPEDNPFFKVAKDNGRATWALGFRNPFTFHFQNGTDRMFANDVGAESWEEINEVIAGQNYGWPLHEGTSDDPRFKAPIYTYAHGPVTSDTMGCAITGGTFYDPVSPLYPKQYFGQYFFIDYCAGWMRILNPETHAVEPFGRQLASSPVSLEVGPDGKLYYLSLWYHGLYAISYEAPHPSPT